MIRFILFDLDNTLYPASSGLDRAISHLMSDFVADYLRITWEEAHLLRKTVAVPFGTTLQWLRLAYGFHDMDAYFEAVHPKNLEDYIPYDPALEATLESISLPKAILTNSPIEHARRVLSRLQVEKYFPRVFDIRYNKFRGKPYSDAYHNVIREIGEDIKHVLFVDDLPHYILPFRNLGGHGLLVDEEGVHINANLPVISKITDLNSYLQGGKI